MASKICLESFRIWNTQSLIVWNFISKARLVYRTQFISLSFLYRIFMKKKSIRFFKTLFPGSCYSYSSPYTLTFINPLNAELNLICHLLALLAHHILHVSRIRVNIPIYISISGFFKPYLRANSVHSCWLNQHFFYCKLDIILTKYPLLISYTSLCEFGVQVTVHRDKFLL